MAKRAKLKKKKFWIRFKRCFYIVLTLLVCHVTYGILMNIKLYSSNEEFLTSLLQNSNHHLLYEGNKNNLVSKFTRFLSEIDMKKPVTILENMFHYNAKEESELVFHDNYNPDDLEGVSDYIEDPNPKEIKNPIVYIYNSHQLENYNATNYEAYNITPNVMMASYLLREKLNAAGIPAIAEESNLTEFIRANNWNYNYSYEASRYFIKDAMTKHKTLKFFIDLHRDALSKAASTTTIKEKKYAKILFVVGLEHKNYQKNLALANTLNQKFNQKYPTLSRGVLTKKGPDVDGIYNQDLNPNMILLEVGGDKNTIDEVLNTIEAVTEILKEHLK